MCSRFSCEACKVSTHSRAEAAATYLGRRSTIFQVSTHSRAEAAALYQLRYDTLLECFNTQPRGGGCFNSPFSLTSSVKFQHTAARRRLRPLPSLSLALTNVSTHSRAEAAARRYNQFDNLERQFQHTAARRRLRGG